ncbi:hypothetical protein J4E80_005002 [Alternaria sp. BMP 0032]|nr:hypothetical protein J4E80_005002 [Alternaria sp. BMP 0032]
MAAVKKKLKIKRTKFRKRRSTVYDAVKRRVARTGLIHNISDPKASRKPLRPDEVLFKRKNAPIRYEEDDYYPAHNKLPPDQKLPSGDLATAMKAYVERLWLKTGRRRRFSRKLMRRTWRGLNETALIALCILMEETARDALGETGDLAFTEAAEEHEHEILTSLKKAKRAKKSGAQKQGTGKEKEQSSVGKEKQPVEKKTGKHVTWVSSDESSSTSSFDDSEESDDFEEDLD